MGWLAHRVIGVGHMLTGLALTAPHHVDAWFSGAVWDENSLT